jgi:hypothetical protein
LSGVSSGGGATSRLRMGRWISWLSSSVAIQVQRVKSNHDGPGWFQPAGGNGPLVNSPSFLVMGWDCWEWPSSRLSLNTFLL